MCKLMKETSTLITLDRLAVLTKDHLAMERLRSGKIELALYGTGFRPDWSKEICQIWVVVKRESNADILNDPAAAILEVKEE